ncbi:hypothetical protein P7K49_002899 [Saguinus oedipus]|uniref:Thioredoxin domain-containing protein n=1 Tax=Saguinus oedipus TaxID=9490 RepID=A0ABQ9WIM5_SAGOE|nr:hypothetical protein P7K49_002899 [Saguinus oedipus]
MARVRAALGYQNHWASESVLWLKEEGYCWELAVEEVSSAGPGMAVEKSSPSVHLDPLVLPTQVSAVPTVLAMKNGDVVDKFVGIKDEDQLEAFLKKLIG